MPEFVHSTLYFLRRWLSFGSVVFFFSLAFGCGTDIKHQIPIDTANLLPKELAVSYLQTVWGETQPNEEGMLLNELGMFGAKGTKFFKYQELGVICLNYKKIYEIHLHRHIDTPLYSHGKVLIQDRANAIKICTALFSLGVQLQEP